MDEYERKKIRSVDKPQEIVSSLKIINWNVAHPSLVRAKRQAEWLFSVRSNVVILTETSSGPGSEYLHDRLEGWRYEVVFRKKRDDFGTMLAFRGFEGEEFNLGLKFLPHRVPAIIFQTP